MTKIKLIASDLDGTLLNDKGEISTHTKDAVLNALSKDILFIPISARKYSEIPAWLCENKDIKYVVCTNGAYIMDNQSAEIMHTSLIERNKVLEIIEAALPINKYWSIITYDHIYSSKEIVHDQALLLENDPFFDIDMLMKTRVFIDFNTLKTIDDLKCGKIHFITAPNKKTLKTVVSSFSDLTISESCIHNLEITSNNASKGLALQYLASIENILHDEILAFGDNENDISLLNSAKYGIAIKNATDGLKSCAYEVATLTNDEDGVATYIDKYLKD